ncbi:uncharacterized protein [Palaemon carinicauda]|uniref:uncharacterized protein n=1 Tax=Palaemon carinicauda TaxID=392227 RepID=UPI0035B5DAA4
MKSVEKMSSFTPKQFHCPDCGKEFSKEKKLLSHLKVHSTRKTYKCEVCKLTFSQKSLYKKHIRLHFEKGTCNCPKCGKVFVRHSWLKKHLDHQCNDSDQNTKFVCRDCGKMYDSLAGVRSHLRKGKHMVPVFMCYYCKCVCSCSEALFFHVLQHGNVDLITVGVDKEQQLVCFSTSKIREKVDVTEFKPDSTSEDNRDIGKALSESILEADELENLTHMSENIGQQNIMQSSNISLLAGDMSQCQSETFEDLYNETPDDAIHCCEKDTEIVMPCQEKEDTFNLVSPIDSLKAILPQDGICSESVSQNNDNFAGENYVCSAQRRQENLHPSCDVIAKKMPKLLNLYPDEERSVEDNMCSVRGNSIMLQNEVSLPHNGICSEVQADPVTSRHNESLPYTTPLVNTMFLPPLFLIHNTLPINPNIHHQNTFLTGERLIDNQPMPDNTSATTIMDELKNMTDEITVPHKKKKRNSRYGKKYPGIFQLKKNDTSHYMSPHKKQTNTPQLPLQAVAAVNSNLLMSQSTNCLSSDHTLTFPQENRIQRLEDLVNLTEQMNGSNSDMFKIENSNHYHNQTLQEKNQSCNVFWEILIGNDESDGKIVNSMSASFRNQSNIQNNGQNCTGEIFSSNRAPTEKEVNLKLACDISTIRCQQQLRSKEGIGVEDYIKKFMWL